MIIVYAQFVGVRMLVTSAPDSICYQIELVYKKQFEEGYCFSKVLACLDSVINGNCGDALSDPLLMSPHNVCRLIDESSVTKIYSDRC